MNRWLLKLADKVALRVIYLCHEGALIVVKKL